MIVYLLLHRINGLGLSFIDYRKFKNNEELILFLENMTEKTFQSYIKNIKKYLLSNYFKQNFGLNVFSNNIIKPIKDDLSYINR